MTGKNLVPDCNTLAYSERNKKETQRKETEKFFEQFWGKMSKTH